MGQYLELPSPQAKQSLARLDHLACVSRHIVSYVLI